MQVTMYSGFSKEVNSTKVPGGGSIVDMTLKEPTSVINPIFIISNYSLDWNYVKWGSRYYFIDDIVIIHNNVAEYHCSTDVLATYRNSIGSSTQYVLRSASDYDGNVMDMFYPISSAQVEVAENATTDPGWTHNISSGQFVIGVMGDNASSNGGAVTYYAISPSGMTAISNYLLDVANYGGVTDITVDLLKCVFNPLQYIVSCMWFPFTVATLSTQSIYVGWWEITGVECAVVSDPVYTRNLSFKVPKHPLANTRGNYLNMLPFSKYYCNAGPWGVIPINNSLLIGESNVSFELNVDVYTGTGRLSLVCSDVIAYASDYMAQIGVPVQLGQNTLNQGAISGIFSGTGEIVTGAAAGGNIFNGLTTSIASVASLAQSTPSTVGSNGSIAFNKLFRLVGEFMIPVAESVSKNGRPLCAPRTISSLHGFIQVHNADVNITGTPTEKEAIIRFMESGFYYE